MDIKTWYQVKYAYGTAYGRGLPLTADEYCNALCEYLNTELESLPLLRVDNLNNLVKGTDGIAVDENETGTALEIHLDQNVLNKVNNAVQKTGSTLKVYATDTDGNEQSVSYSTEAIPYTFVLRNANARVNVGYAANDTEAVNVAYLNNALSGYAPIDKTTSSYPMVYGKLENGSQIKFGVFPDSQPNTIMYRDPTANAQVSTRPDGDSSRYIANTQFVANAITNSIKDSNLYVHNVQSASSPLDKIKIITNFSSVITKSTYGWSYPEHGIILSINARNKVSNTEFNINFSKNMYGSMDYLYYIVGGDTPTISSLQLSTYDITDVVSVL